MLQTGFNIMQYLTLKHLTLKQPGCDTSTTLFDPAGGRVHPLTEEGGRGWFVPLHCAELHEVVLY